MKHRAYACVPASVMALLACNALAQSGQFLAFNRVEDSVITAHRERQAEITESQQVILNRAEQETRDLTAAEQTEIEGLANEFDDLERQIELRERATNQANRLREPQGRQSEPDAIDGDEPPARPANHGERSAPQNGRGRAEPQPRATARGTGGFRHLGDFANSVRQACVRGGEMDPRLRNAAASTISQESVGADGGFAVPPDFRSEILSRVFGEDSLIARTDRMQSSSNTLTLPVDMTTPWQTTGGIQAYWTAEGGTKQQSKVALEEVTLKLNTLATLVPVTEELLEDAPAMDAYLRRKVPEKMDFKLSDSIIWGSGAGQPLGIMRSPALVTVGAESGQTADTINATNVLKMNARMPVASRRNAVWLIHPDAEVQLPLMTIGQQPMYVPPGGLRDNPYGVLLGRPVIPHQSASSIGDLGDIVLADLGQYLTATKSGGGRDANGMRTDVSIHLWFDQDLVAYRFTVRVAGQPWWSQPLSQKNGSNTQSPFVTLAAR